MISANQKNQIIEITSKFNPKMIGIFSSYTGKENKHNSNLDILIDFE